MEIYNIFCLISKICYTFLYRSTASDCERFWRWSARRHCRSGRHRSLEYRQLVLDGCGLTHAGANLQGFGNYGDQAGLVYALNFGLVCNRRPANAGVAQTQSRQMPNENEDQVKIGTVNLILGPINAPKLLNGRYQKMTFPVLPERSSNACTPLTTCSTAAAAKWTSAHEETSTSPMMNSSITTFFSDLVLLIYYTFLRDYLKFNTNLELNPHKNIFLK